MSTSKITASNQIDIRLALRVFEKIRQEGKKNGEEYTLNGISATSDYDGYTIVLFNDYVSVSIFFHNKYKIEYSNTLAWKAFMEHLEILGKD